MFESRGSCQKNGQYNYILYPFYIALVHLELWYTYHLNIRDWTKSWRLPFLRFHFGSRLHKRTLTLKKLIWFDEQRPGCPICWVHFLLEMIPELTNDERLDILMNIIKMLITHMKIIIWPLNEHWQMTDNSYALSVWRYLGMCFQRSLWIR